MKQDHSSVTGIHGFSNRFYQDNWDLVKEGIGFMIKDLFSKAKIVQKAYLIHIILMLRAPSGSNIHNLRSISLSSNMVKFFIGMIRHTRIILNYTISSNQSVLLPGRSIQDVISLCQKSS